MRTLLVGEATGLCAAMAVSLSLILCGCSDTDQHAGPVANGEGDDAANWHRDIAPIVSEKCLTCHQTGGIAPFSMQTYASAKPWASAMAAAVEQGTMPPFLADETKDCTQTMPWYQDQRLSSDQKRSLRSWADAGAPEGKAAANEMFNVPPPPKLDREDVVIKLPEPIHVEGNRDIHTCIVVDPGLDHDSYVKGRLVTAGNARVLHHVVSYIVQPGKNEAGEDRDKSQLEAAIHDAQGVGIGGRYDCFGGASLPGLNIEMLDAWAPGVLPNIAPPDSAQPLDKDALILLDVHYHPTGEPQVDSETTLSLTLADERPALISRVILMGNAEKHEESESGVSDLMQQPDEDHPEFTIPPDVSAHIEEMTWRWKLRAGFALRVYGLGTHMHYVGRDMRVTLEHPDSESQCLIETPHWNFNWQRGYGFDVPYDEMPTMVNGDTLRLHCSYDNTMDNRFVAQALSDRGLDAPIRVNLGEDTLDEMCIVGLGVIYPNVD